MSPKFSIARFFTALAGLLLALFFWELVLRAQRPQILNSPVFDHDPMVGNCYLPNLSAYQEYYGVASRLHTNAERLRQADDIPVEKAAGEKRVLVLGSSFTAGIGVGDEDTFVQLLQAAARRKYPSRKTVFMNAAVPGVGTVHAVTYLHYRGEALNPDFVLLVIGPNDVDANLGTGGWKPFVIPSSGPIQWTGEPAPKFPGTEMRVLLRKIPFYDFVISRSHLLGWARTQALATIAAREEAKKLAEEARKPPREPAATSPQVSAENLTQDAFTRTADSLLALKQECESRGIRFMVATAGTQISATRTAQFIKEYRTWFAAHGIDFLDPSPALPANVAPLLYPGGDHLNQEGHRAFAEILWPELERKLTPVLGTSTAER